MRIHYVAVVPLWVLAIKPLMIWFAVLMAVLCLGDVSVHAPWRMNLINLAVSMPGVLIIAWRLYRKGLFGWLRRHRWRRRPQPTAWNVTPLSPRRR